MRCSTFIIDMKTHPSPKLGRNSVIALCLAMSVDLLTSGVAVAAGRSQSADLFIVRDPGSGQLNLSWTGGGTLKQSRTLGGASQPVRARGRSHKLVPTEDQLVFTLESAGPIFSVNIVGYINVRIPPGVSLIANQLWNQDNSVALLINNPADGTQVYKYVEGVGYEVSTFDGESQTWSNPDMSLPPGTGFFYRNPTSETIVNTFVGEVRTGTLVNRLPAGFSTEAAIIPQTITLSEHLIPGEPGDMVRFHINDGQGGESYVTSIYSETEGTWVPDLTLNVGQGFISERAHAVDWVRVFSVN